MTLTHETAKLYIYSKKLKQLNKKLHKLSKKAHKHKDKNQGKHTEVIKKTKKLMTEHNKILSKLRIHYHRFVHELRKEQK